MHWTALLAYRRIPPTAQVVGDVGCIHCGYNLRGLRAGGSCPECGHAVGESLFLLARPMMVAASIRSFANTYITFTGLLLAIINNTVSWPLIVCAAMLSAGAVYRAWCAIELRVRGELKNSDILLHRAHWLAIAAGMEALTTIAWFAAILFAAKSPLTPAALTDQLLRGIFTAWLIVTFATAVMGSRFGSALTDLVGSRWTSIELRIHRWLLIVTVFSIAFTAVVLGLGVATVWIMLAVVPTGILILLSVFATWLAMHHVANTAELAQETWDELLDSERLAIVASAKPFHDPRPAIPVAEAESNPAALRPPQQKPI